MGFLAKDKQNYPIGNNAVLDGVLEGQDSSLGLGLVTNVGILLSHADHDTLVTGAANNRRKDSARSVVTSESGLAHSGAIVNHESLNFFVAHFDFELRGMGIELFFS